MKNKNRKSNTIYEIKDFQRPGDFINDIRKDLDLFQKIKREVEEERLVEDDPKRETIHKTISKIIKDEPERKIILFTEYVDTVNHLASFFRKKLGNKVLVCDRKVTRTLAKELERNFNAQYKGTKANDIQVLITSDKLSEGFNLNRAGAIINYDIPWNPIRVIQRVGRINRIGSKVFDELYIFNFFPSETGADFVKSREIARQKMYMIHNALGEDAQIFDKEEEPTAARLYKKINNNVEDDEELNMITRIINLYAKIEEKYPEVIERIERLPKKIKSAKQSKMTNVNVLRKKGLGLFAQQTTSEKGSVVESLTFEQFLEFVQCEYGTKRLPMSQNIWPSYELIKAHREKIRSNKNDLAIETKAHNNLKVALKVIDESEEENISFIRTLINDIKHYYTMPKYTLRRLASEKLTPDSSESKWRLFFKEIEIIKNRYGTNYLENVLSGVKHQKDEVIIAVENTEDITL